MEQTSTPEEILSGFKDLYGLSTPFHACVAMLSRYLKDPSHQLWTWSDKFEQARIVQIKTMNARLNSFVLNVIEQTAVDSLVSTRYIYDSFCALRLAEQNAPDTVEESLKKVNLLKKNTSLFDIQKSFVNYLDKSDVINDLTLLSFIGIALSTGAYDIKTIWDIWLEYSTSYYLVEV